jgi:hypothetical protein
VRVRDLLREEKRRIGSYAIFQIANLTRALSDGYSPSITNELAQLERQFADAPGQLTNPDPLAVEKRMRATRKFVELRLADLRGLLNSEASTVRFEIAKHEQEIALTPTGRTYFLLFVWYGRACRRVVLVYFFIVIISVLIARGSSRV